MVSSIRLAYRAVFLCLPVVALSLALRGLAIAADESIAEPAATSAAADSTSTTSDSTMAAAASTSAAPFAPQFKPSLDVRRALGLIRIDGSLDDPGWAGAARAAGFAEVNPGDQIRPPVESEAWVTYDAENVYFALIARDDPATLRVSLHERDAIFTDEYFGIMLDPAGDHDWGYELFVNPLGIQGDLRMLSNGEEEIAFDVIFTSKGLVTADGYQVEIAVPFASLRFPDREEQTWRVNFWRDHRREVHHQYAWAARDRDDPCFMCSWGTLTGIRGVHPKRNLDLIGNVLGHRSGSRLDGPPASFHNEAIKGEASLNLRYGLNSASSAEVTLNPDFSQIESDAGEIDFNNPFAIDYPEKRPFFQEGSDLYDTWINVIHTRSINNPDWAGKVTGKNGRTAFALLGARDANAPVLLPMAERSAFLLGGQATSGIARVRRSFGEDSWAGLFATDRRLDRASGGGAGTVFGFDVRHRFLSHYKIAVQSATSRTEEPSGGTPGGAALNAQLEEQVGPLAGQTFDGRHTVALDGERYWGSGLFVDLERNGRVWNLALSTTNENPTFRTDTGFLTRNDYRNVDLWTGLEFMPNGNLVVSWEPSLAAGRAWTWNRSFRDEWLQPRLEIGFKRTIQVEGSYYMGNERYAGAIFGPIRTAQIEISGNPVQTIEFNANGSRGRTISRRIAPAQLGDMTSVGGAVTVRTAGRFAIGQSISFSRLTRPDGQESEGQILRTRIDAQVTRELSGRAIFELDRAHDRIRFEPLLTYRMDAFTVAYLGIADHYDLFDENLGSGLPSGNRAWDLSARQIFAKVQVLFRV